MSIAQNIQNIENQLVGKGVNLIAVTKTKPIEMLMEAYDAGFKRFGENYVQELVEKHERMPKDIEWHLIGHLQTNKVKYIAPFVSMIHSVDSFKLMKEINKQAQKNNRIIDCLLQIYIAEEDSKTGMTEEELYEILNSEEINDLKNIRIVGLMGMSTFTDNLNQVRKEFRKLKEIFDKVKRQELKTDNSQRITHHSVLTVTYSALTNRHSAFKTLSMGMSSDWQIAVEEGSTMIRVGSAIFGNR